ncbi:MAG: hypothetical protein HQK49_08690 [Oligoflexia bacterium]|nr:hypothetical protein [Oligoflexia bacterium]
MLKISIHKFIIVLLLVLLFVLLFILPTAYSKTSYNLYVRPFCSNSIHAMNELSAFYKKMGEEKVALNIHYLGKIDINENLITVGGEKELQETLKQICIKIQDKQLQNDISSCINGSMAKKIAFEDFLTSTKFNKFYSPILVINDKIYEGEISQEKLLRSWCNNDKSSNNFSDCNNITECSDYTDCFMKENKWNTQTRYSCLNNHCAKSDVVKVNVDIFTDSRCQSNSCKDLHILISMFKEDPFIKFNINTYDVVANSEKLTTNMVINSFPTIIFDAAIEKTELFQRMKKKFIKNKNFYVLQFI